MFFYELQNTDLHQLSTGIVYINGRKIEAGVGLNTVVTELSIVRNASLV